ncbi:MDR family MFS transporter [Micromonospora sp. NPDC002389]|uniref:MDR family MFS transporter n=1 Tax=Micromonospora sp. NPDC002389 TaxID=3154272 RepID=UPI00332E5CE6
MPNHRSPGLADGQEDSTTAAIPRPAKVEPTTENRLDGRLIRLSMIIVAGAFMSALDATIVAVALDRIGTEFESPLSALQWVTIGYLLALAMVVPVTGWVVERFGARRMWLVSLSLFIVASVWCGFAWSIGSLIAFRVLQGLGGGLIPPLAQVILVRAAGPKRIGRVMSAVSVPTQLAPIIGPTVGGLLVDSVGWRWIFYINIPLGVLALVVAGRGLPKDERLSSPRLDVVGLLLLSPAVTALVYGLSVAGEGAGFRSTGVIVALCAGLLLLLAFFWHARREHPSPVIDLRLFRHRPFAVSSVLHFLAGASLFGLMFLLPLYYQQVRGVDSLQAGLLLAPQGLGMVAALIVAGSLVDRYGARRVALAGILLSAIGTVPFTYSGATEDDIVSATVLVVRGLGLGIASIPLTAAAYYGLTQEMVPRAASALVIVQRLGGSLGTTMLALILQRQTSHASGNVRPPTPEALETAYVRTFWWTVVLTAVALLPAFFMPGRAEQNRAGQADLERHTKRT